MPTTTAPAYVRRDKRHRRSRMQIGPPRSKLRRLFAQQHGRCIYCNSQMVLHQAVWGEPIPPSAATRDHIIPRAKGGKQLKNNVVAACNACNLARGSEAWSLFLARTAPTFSHFLVAYLHLSRCVNLSGQASAAGTTACRIVPCEVQS